MRVRVAILLLISWASLGSLRSASVSTAYYDLSLQNQPSAGGNVRLTVQLKPNVEKALVRIEQGTDALLADLEFSIEARVPGTRQVRHAWRFRRQVRQAAGAGDGLVRAFSLAFSPGAYDVDVELHDLHSHRRYLESLSFECVPPPLAYGLSDLDVDVVTAFGPFSLAQPLHGLKVETQPDSLRFQCTITAPSTGMLTARAVLYRQQAEAGSPALEASKHRVQHFRTYLQQADIVRAAAGQTRYQGAFHLHDAPDGRYLLELTLYKDEDQLAQVSRSIELEWPRLREVFADLGQAIAWMKWIASPQERARLAAIRDADQQQQAFTAWWQARVPPGGGDARSAMKQYFSRVFIAQETLPGQGWDSDEGRTVILYGTPDMQASIPMPAMRMAVWIYRDWNMAFLFRELEGKMKIIPI